MATVGALKKGREETRGLEPFIWGYRRPNVDECYRFFAN